MTEPGMNVTPYWELTFDADGGCDRAGRDRLLDRAARHGVRNLVVFAHGWNNDRTGARRLCSRFLAPFPALAPAARLGYVGVLWPSMRFSDEPIPGLSPPVAAEVPAAVRAVLGKGTRQGLLEVFPGRAPVVDRLAALLDRQPDDGPALEEFGRLVRLLVSARPGAPGTASGPSGADTLAGGVPQGDPEMLSGDPVAVCADFAATLAEIPAPDGAPAGVVGAAAPGLWDGAHELLRQATYYTMKRRAGTVGERGLGPVLGRLAAAAPEIRVHLVGHSFGARLVSFALRGLPEGVRTVKSVTLLQGAFSHYAFASRLPHDARASGVLRGRQRRVDGPLVCCHSRHDSALGTVYPLASRMAGDARSVAGAGLGGVLGEKWGALGYGGVLAVPGTRSLTLAEALRTGLPAAGCVNVDASAVVRRGGPPSGAHSDICHGELARVVLAAGRMG